MRALLLAPMLGAALAGPAAFAHGPQIQITVDEGAVLTRRLILDGPYSGSLRAATRVYVMPLLPFSGVWYARPNIEMAAPGVPAYFSGPGLAYGYDLADGGTQEFSAGSILSLGFVDGLKLWNGTAFGDAGLTELKAFRGSNANIVGPPENFAVTSDSIPFDSLDLPAVAADYGTDGAEVHSTIRYALLGDGSSPASGSPNSVYLATLRISSSQANLAPSEAFYFVLQKNASNEDVLSAVNSLGVAPSLVQWVPEPGSAALLVVGGLGLLATARRRHKFPRGKR